MPVILEDPSRVTGEFALFPRKFLLDDTGLLILEGNKKTRRLWVSGRKSAVEGEGIENGVDVGNDLLSHVATHILPSVLVDLTAGFEMGPGVPPPLKSPTNPPVILNV